MIRAGIVGATGYTALELILILLRHPQVRITRLTSRNETPQALASVHPRLRDELDVEIGSYDAADFRANVDCAFCCLPHAASSPVVRELADAGVRVVDFSADYRLDSLAEFQRIYQAEHADPDRLGRVPYGLPELFREQIRTAEVIANPGCFPTSAILPLAPLLRDGWILPDDIIVDSKTGVSGGGRTPKLAFHYPECNESIAAYSVGVHRHGPEINQILERWSGVPVESTFVPHLVPMTRGILSTIYVHPAGGKTAGGMLEHLRGFYAQSRFVRVTDALPATRDVSLTNFCDLAVRPAGKRIAIVSAIDNLIKGASGAAVQNMNVMFDLPESTGL